MNGSAALRRSSERPRPANAVEEALSLPVHPFTLGDWRLVGPTKTDSFAVMEGQRALAVVTAADVSPVEAKGNAMLFVRSAVRQTMLEHILAELEADDDGSRWGDLTRMIREELSKTP